MLGWFKRLVGIYSALGGQGRAFLDGVFGSRVGDPPERGTLEFLQAYQTSPWVRAVHGRISTVIGSTVWTLTARGREVPPDHLMLRTLASPNRLMTGFDLIKITQLYLDLVGDAFLLKVRNGFNAPVELWPIPPHWIAELPTPARPQFRVSYYSWQGFVPDTDVLWCHDAAPADPYRRGTGIVRSQSDEIETHEYASKHAKQLFWNRAIPEFVVMDEAASPDEIGRHERHWLQRLQGFWRWNKPYFVNRKLEFWQPQQMHLDNLTMVPLMKYERDLLLQTIGMPPEQLGIVENSNRATIDGSDYVFETRIVKPRRDFLRDALQMKLAPEYDERLTVGYVDTVPQDKDHALNVMKSAPHAWSVDEWRARVQDKPVGGPLGSARLVPINAYLTTDPLDQTQRPGAAAPPQASEPPGEERPERPDDEEQTRIWRHMTAVQ